jgi:hypothetical protein
MGVLAVVQTGCLVVAAGVAGGAAATGYVYYKGRLYRDYLAGLNQALEALRASLLELQFPIIAEESKNGTSYIASRTSDGSTMRIYVEPVPSRIPAEGTLTRVSIRVGAFGDEALSTRFLDQVGAHLAGPTLLRPAPVAPAVPPPVQPASARVVAETPAPPLAAPVPLAAKGK